MKERPILFSGPMVRALLNGRKTQTRRVVKPQPAYPDSYNGERNEFTEGYLSWFFRGATQASQIWKCPYAPGDRFWVRETHANLALPGYEPVVVYRADGEMVLPPGVKWTPSIHMPRWVSRLTLEVTGVRVERVQDISGEDAKAEGVTSPRCGCEVCSRSSLMCPADASSHIEEFRTLWQSINDRPWMCWDENPWVWVVSFKLVD